MTNTAQKIQTHTPGPLTPAQVKVLRLASIRQPGFLCPTPGIHAAAQMALLKSLRAKGYATDSHSPQITDAGRAALAKVQS